MHGNDCFRSKPGANFRSNRRIYGKKTTDRYKQHIHFPNLTDFLGRKGMTQVTEMTKPDSIHFHADDCIGSAVLTFVFIMVSRYSAYLNVLDGDRSAAFKHLWFSPNCARIVMVVVFTTHGNHVGSLFNIPVFNRSA